jgi:hypothetical protein
MVRVLAAQNPAAAGTPAAAALKLLRKAPA